MIALLLIGKMFDSNRLNTVQYPKDLRLSDIKQIKLSHPGFKEVKAVFENKDEIEECLNLLKEIEFQPDGVTTTSYYGMAYIVEICLRNNESINYAVSASCFYIGETTYMVGTGSCSNFMTYYGEKTGLDKIFDSRTEDQIILQQK